MAISSTRFPKFSSFNYSSACISRNSHIRYMTYPSHPAPCDILRSVRGIMFHIVPFFTPPPTRLLTFLRSKWCPQQRISKPPQSLFYPQGEEQIPCRHNTRPRQSLIS
jgi:hypothetical protein